MWLTLTKNSLCVAVMFFNICLQVNNEYSDVPIGQAYKYKIRISCNNFVSVDCLFRIYENMC